MSRIGIQPITIPDSVKINLNQNQIQLTGPKGNINETIPNTINIEQKDKTLLITRKLDDQRAKALHGYVRANLANAIKGVSEGWNKTLSLVGVGFRASTDSKKLTLTVGFSHTVDFMAPEGITFKVAGNDVIVSGINKQLVGETSAMIRRIKPPEIYKGKGIRYKDEVIKLKPGKAAKTVGGAAAGAK